MQTISLSRVADEIRESSTWIVLPKNHVLEGTNHIVAVLCVGAIDRFFDENGEPLDVPALQRLYNGGVLVIGCADDLCAPPSYEVDSPPEDGMSVVERLRQDGEALYILTSGTVAANSHSAIGSLRNNALRVFLVTPGVVPQHLLDLGLISEEAANFVAHNGIPSAHADVKIRLSDVPKGAVMGASGGDTATVNITDPQGNTCSKHASNGQVMFDAESVAWS